MPLSSLSSPPASRRPHPWKWGGEPRGYGGVPAHPARPVYQWQRARGRGATPRTPHPRAQQWAGWFPAFRIQPEGGLLSRKELCYGILQLGKFLERGQPGNKHSATRDRAHPP